MLARCQYGLSYCFSRKIFFFDYLEDGGIKPLRNLITKLPINNFTPIRSLGLSPNPLLPYVMQPIFPPTYSIAATRKKEAKYFPGTCTTNYLSTTTDLLQLSPKPLLPSTVQPVLPEIYSS
jgi:hypothetical protein